MSDNNKNKKRSLTDFIRYRKDEMTGEERNSFERKLQKDPFAEEAAEGFALISPEQSLTDSAHLQKHLKTRINRRQRFMYYRLAASVAVLMVISTIYIIVEKNKPSKQLAETAVQTEALEITETQPLTEPVAKDISSEKPIMISKKKADKSFDQQIRMETAKGTVAVENAKIATAQIIDSRPENKLKPVEEYVADEQLAAPAKVSKEFEAKADSQVQVRLDPSVSALSEVVVVGYGVRKAESEKEDIYSGYVPPLPVNGKSAFDKYIHENLHRPDTTTEGQRVVVVVSFIVHANGSVDSIRIVKSPGKLFSEEAIRLIKSGPSWKPAEDNGKITEDEVRVRIVFK
jgi:TonB family protein